MSPEVNRRSRRQRMWIAPHMQLPLIRTSVVHASVAVLVPALILILPLVVQLRNKGTLALDLSDQASSLLYLHDRFWLAAVAVFVLIVLDAIRVSHRIAGPLYRMTRVMRDAAQGHPQSEFVPRKRDYLHREAAALNELLAYTSRLEEDAARAASRLDEVLAEHGRAYEQGWLAGIQDARDMLRHEPSRCGEAELGVGEADRE